MQREGCQLGAGAVNLVQGLSIRCRARAVNSVQDRGRQLGARTRAVNSMHGRCRQLGAGPGPTTRCRVEAVRSTRGWRRQRDARPGTSARRGAGAVNATRGATRRGARAVNSTQGRQLNAVPSTQRSADEPNAGPSIQGRGRQLSASAVCSVQGAGWLNAGAVPSAQCTDVPSAQRRVVFPAPSAQRRALCSVQAVSSMQAVCSAHGRLLNAIPSTQCRPVCPMLDRLAMCRAVCSMMQGRVLSDARAVSQL